MAAVEVWTQHSPQTRPVAVTDAHAELAALYTELRPRLLGRVKFRWRIGGDLAEDLVHDAWVRAIEHIDSFDRSRPFEPWAMRIIDNVVIDHLRRTRTGDGHARHMLVDVIDLDHDVETPHEVDRVGDRELLRNAMATLPPRQQATAVGVLIDGLSLDEAAERMKLSNTACRQLLHRARLGLRRALLDQGVLPGLAPGLWLRHRWATIVRRLGGPEASAVAGSTATVVALVVTVAMTVAAGNAIARDRGDDALGFVRETAQHRDRDNVRAEVRRGGKPAVRDRKVPTASSTRAHTTTPAQAAPSPGDDGPDGPVEVPDVEVPVTGTRINDDPPRKFDYEYGVNIQVAGPAGSHVGAEYKVRTKEGGSVADSKVVPHAAACDAAARAPMGFCRESSD
jgi:RNA polymerase sigma-70 factor (ECF subfamily)